MDKKLSLRVRERDIKMRGGGGGGLKLYIIFNLFSLLLFF